MLNNLFASGQTDPTIKTNMYTIRFKNYLFSFRNNELPHVYLLIQKPNDVYVLLRLRSFTHIYLCIHFKPLMFVLLYSLHGQ